MGVDIDKMTGGYCVSDLLKKGIDIVNVSATFQIEGEFDRQQLSEDLPNSKYDPKKHRSLIYDNGDAVILLPPSGRASITKTTTREEIIQNIEDFVAELARIGITRDYSNIQIENIVGTANIGKALDLNAVALSLGLENTEYEPEQFPGVIYRIPDGAVVLVFSSGKIVITKATTHADLVKSFEHIRELVSNTTV